MSALSLPANYDHFAYFEAEHAEIIKHGEASKNGAEASFEKTLKDWAAHARSEWREEHLKSVKKD